jgi:hypothetical protein
MAIVLVVLAGGCGDAQIVPLPVHDISEPWQPRPFAVDQTLVTTAERTCRDVWHDSIPDDVELVLVDARGGGQLLLLFGAPGFDQTCLVVRDAAGVLQSAGGGGGNGPRPDALGPNQLLPGGGGSQTGLVGPNAPPGTTSYALGTAGANIAAVDIVLASGGPLRASLNRGWYAAWWPSGDSPVSFRGYDAMGAVVASSP